MEKKKVSIKEQYGSLKHFLKGDEDCHYIGQRYIGGHQYLCPPGVAGREGHLLRLFTAGL